jgi:hypothetical protein
MSCFKFKHSPGKRGRAAHLQRLRGVFEHLRKNRDREMLPLPVSLRH